MTNNELIISTITVFVSIIIADYLRPYLRKKSENNATKEDIKEITLKIEQVKSEISMKEFGMKAELEDNLKYRALQHALFVEIPPVIARVNELINKPIYSGLYKQINENDELDYEEFFKNKNTSTVFRILRLFATYEIYLYKASELPSTKIHKVVTWYFDRKIIPVFASGGYASPSILWRDEMRFASERMIEFSEKWKSLKVSSIASFINELNCHESESNQFKVACNKISKSLNEGTIRTILLGIYLIDVYQDIIRTNEFESERNNLLRKLVPTSSEISLYGKTVNGENDLKVMNIELGIIPRNINSFLYDFQKNPIGYKINKKQDI